MVAMADVEGFTNALACEFKPKRIILFGSQVRSECNDASDVDLLVTMNYRGSRLQAAARIIRKLQPRFAVDLVIRTEDELADRLEKHDDFLIDVMRTGRVLYEAIDEN